MNVLKTPEFKVGLFVLVVSLIVGAMSMKVSDDPNYLGRAYNLKFKIKDAAGLIKKSAVKTAGINIGVIKDITLDNGEALITVSIDGAVKVPKSSRVEVRANGILGDKYVEFIRGVDDGQNFSDGDTIDQVRDNGSIAILLNEVGKIAKSISEVSDSIRDASTGEGSDKTPIGRIVKNLETLTKNLAEISDENKDKISETLDNLHAATATINDVINSEEGDGLKAKWKQVAKSLDRLDRSLKNIEEVTEKVNGGKGTIGKLLNDEKTVDEINTAVENVNDFFGGVKKLQTSIEFKGEYLGEQAMTKSYLGVKIQPGLDRYYEVAVIDDPKGVVEKTTTSTNTSSGGGPFSNTTSNETKTFRNKIKFTALFAKNFYDFTIKAGLIESYGGVGIDYYLYRKNLRLSAEFFNFSNMHVKSYFRYNFYKGLFLHAGAEDLLAKEAYSTFVGAGLFLTNDDLKMLAGGFK